MDDDERIRAHLVSVWREARKRFSVGGREGMLLLTDRHLCFVQKTESKKRWWTVVVDRQALKLMRSKDTMILHDGYGEEDLRRDLENTKNTEIAFDDILDVEYSEKAWGSVLELRYSKDGKDAKFRYMIARDWVKYPLKEPTRYLKVDWGPFVEFIRERRITP
ncbi:hypothetical protein CENSYa_1843 [Cenarchaeum symbiosum A]|uniref:Uncharacterized protein n=1 Tax=Cenarchaeum symbiosum (strain A) TaxID=414004 RepID=A0RYN6_CENSY|nr:hypothetical protein CENSYa_1843 [Cenarchaeum symbiosum A]